MGSNHAGTEQQELVSKELNEDKTLTMESSLFT